MAEPDGPAQADRLARLAVVAVAAAFGVLLVVAALGPSAVEPPLGARHGFRGLLPAYSFDLHPSSGLVTVAVDLAYLVGAVGVGLGLLAVRRGHRLDPRRAGWAAAVLVAVAMLLPPMGSADHLSYAAYGRIAAQGGDPYIQHPILWHDGHDPVTSQVEPPWQRTPSVYGPVATAIQAATSVVGGDSLRTTVWLWQLVCGACWLLVGWLVVRLTASRSGAGSPQQSRAIWLWLANPVLFGVVLMGAHVDVLATAFVLCVLPLAIRQPFFAGVALGAAVGTKLTMLLAVPALLWALRRIGARRFGRTVGLGTVGAALVLVPAHLWAGAEVFHQLRRARFYVALGTPWRPIVDRLDGPFEHQSVRHAVVLLTPVVLLLVAVVMARIVRPAANLRPSPGLSADVSHAVAAREQELFVAEAAVGLLVLLGAYVVAAPYSLPWYGAAAWAPLALVAGGILDALLLVQLTAYAVAYVPGRVLGLSARVERLTLGFRRDVTPWVGGLVLLSLALLALRRRPSSVR